MPSQTFDRTQLLSPLHYVLTVSYAGRVLRFSTTQLDIAQEDGTYLQVDDGLDPLTWKREIGLGSSSPPLPSVPVSILSQTVDWAALRAAGWDPAAAVGELAQWVEGTTWEKRRRLVEGLLIEPTYGALGEEFAASIQAHPYTDRSSLPEATAIVDSTSWPNAAESAEGASYPIVFGYPGRLDGGSTRVPGSPGLIVDAVNRYLLIAGHPTDATTVDVVDEANLGFAVSWVPLAVTHRQDGRGRTVATVTLPALGGHAAFDEDSSYTVSWGNGSNGGGLQDRQLSGPLRGAGDVLEYLLNRTTLRLDRGRTAACAELLNGYKIDGYWDDPMGVWEWIQAHLLPILPVYISQGPDGLYPVAWRFDALAALGSSVETLNADLGDAVRVGMVRTASTLHGEMANEFRIKHGLNDVTGRYRRTMVVHGDPDRESAQGYVPNLACRQSRSRFSTDTASVMEVTSDMVYDRPTAVAIGQALATMHALPVRRVAYMVEPRYGHLREGAPVVVVDLELGYSSVPALVESIEDSEDGMLLLELVIFEAVLLG